VETAKSAMRGGIPSGHRRASDRSPPVSTRAEPLQHGDPMLVGNPRQRAPERALPGCCPLPARLVARPDILGPHPRHRRSRPDELRAVELAAVEDVGDVHRQPPALAAVRVVAQITPEGAAFRPRQNPGFSLREQREDAPAHGLQRQGVMLRHIRRAAISPTARRSRPATGSGDWRRRPRRRRGADSPIRAIAGLGVTTVTGSNGDAGGSRTSAFGELREQALHLVGSDQGQHGRVPSGVDIGGQSSGCGGSGGESVFAMNVCSQKLPDDARPVIMLRSTTPTVE
jgi:hypothetical protein